MNDSWHFEALYAKEVPTFCCQYWHHGIDILSPLNMACCLLWLTFRADCSSSKKQIVAAKGSHLSGSIACSGQWSNLSEFEIHCVLASCYVAKAEHSSASNKPRTVCYIAAAPDTVSITCCLPVVVQAEVGKHEPWLALDGGHEDGLDALRPICAGAANMLQPGGFLTLETAGMMVC